MSIIIGGPMYKFWYAYSSPRLLWTPLNQDIVTFRIRRAESTWPTHYRQPRLTQTSSHIHDKSALTNVSVLSDDLCIMKNVALIAKKFRFERKLFFEKVPSNCQSNKIKASIGLKILNFLSHDAHCYVMLTPISKLMVTL